MNTSFLQPKNSLQRADELCSVGQEVEAFELLQRTILDRKFRYLQWDAIAQQDVVSRFLNLAVKLDRIKQCRDGLLNYRNHCQHGMSMLAPLEKVVLHFRQCAEDRVAAAQGQQLEVAIRVCMDTYRTIIDVVRSTPKLGKVYHGSVVKAHELCQRYALRGDFRRLADLVRSNYASIMKLKPKSTDTTIDPQLLLDIDELKRPEVHIATKLSQLRTAVKLESWKEAQLSIEELFQLGILDLATFRPGKKGAAMVAQAATAQQKQEMLLNCIAQYFEYSSDYFLRCGFWKLHALCMYRYLMQVRLRLQDSVKLRTLSSVTALSILALPLEKPTIVGADGTPAAPFVRAQFEDEERRLAGLTGYGHTPPTRSELIQLLIDKKVVDSVHPAVRGLIEHLNGSGASDPYELLKLLSQVHTEMAADGATDISQYERGIKIFALKKSLQSISQIYESVSIDRFKKLFCPPEFLEWRVAEREVAASSGSSVKFDFSKGALFLNSKENAIDARHLIAHLSTDLLKAVLADQADEEAKKLSEQKRAVREAVARSQKAGGESRLQLIEKKREEIANLRRQLHESREDAERERVKKLTEQEELKILTVKKELEEGRRARELELARVQLAKITVEKIDQLIQQITENPKLLKKLNLVEVQDLDVQKLLTSKLTSERFTEIVNMIIKTKAEEKRVEAKINYRRHDHFARAVREMKVKSVREVLIPEARARVAELTAESEARLAAAQEATRKRVEVLAEYKDVIVNFF